MAGATTKTFWSQIANWSLRRVETGDLSADVAIEQGRGIISVEAIDTDGNFRNFLDLQAVVVNPKGERELVPLTQTAAGRYEAEFETRETGSYLVHLREMEQGKLQASQVIGANLDHSPEFAESRPNLARLERLAEIGGGRLLSRDFGADNPFEHDRRETFQPVDLGSGCSSSLCCCSRWTSACAASRSIARRGHAGWPA